MNLFEKNGACFSECKRYRYSLWRIWDNTKPIVMFIGLNPSTATEAKDDPTIRKVKRFAFDWNFGGVYMLNLFAFISTDPNALLLEPIEKIGFYNNYFLKEYSAKAQEIIFAWGNFKAAEERAKDVIKMFPSAKALHINKNGSPKHPLYCKSSITLKNFQNGNNYSSSST